MNTLTLPKTIKSNDTFLYDKEEIANELNKYFVSVGPNLSQKIPQAVNPISNLFIPNTSQFNLFELTFEEFECAFKMLKPNKSAGADDINVNIVIKSYEIIKNVFFKIFSCSIRQGIFPNQLKIAKVIPIFKGGDLTNVSNYRPISILSAFSKVDTIDHNILLNKLKIYGINGSVLY
ncbi:uncharacterized protein LOC136072343 [Hydra vulgaris]|uniref:uncharacterized protein LOC136072343 n=1 Tax=Hydra vulgaris TaxID=6087 RepID=UPI0032EA1C4B